MLTYLKQAVLPTIIVLTILLFGGGTIYVGWLKAGYQADLYRREGIEITQSEVFWGAKPAEQNIRLKNAK